MTVWVVYQVMLTGRTVVLITRSKKKALKLAGSKTWLMAEKVEVD